MRAPAGMRTRNYTIMPRTGLTGVQYWRRGGLHGPSHSLRASLGMNPHASGDTASAIIGPGIRSFTQPVATPPGQKIIPTQFPSGPLITAPSPAASGPGYPGSNNVVPLPYRSGPGRICPAYGCNRVPPVFTSTSAPAAGSGGSTSAQVAGTPVPVGYSTNSVFIAPNGSQWEYSSAQGKWIDVGTPYNLGTGGGVTYTPTPPSSTGTTYSTAAQVAGTPVPVGYPISSPYGDLYGNTWQFNPATGTWTETAIGSAASAALSAGSAAGTTIVPATAPVVTDTYSSVLAWLSESSLLSPIPNWILVAGLGLVALKFAHGGRR